MGKTPDTQDVLSEKIDYLQDMRAKTKELRERAEQSAADTRKVERELHGFILENFKKKGRGSESWEVEEILVPLVSGEGVISISISHPERSSVHIKTVPYPRFAHKHP